MWRICDAPGVLATGLIARRILLLKPDHHYARELLLVRVALPEDLAMVSAISVGIRTLLYQLLRVW
jgi:hypothetical protein